MAEVFDDRLDAQTEISSWAAARIMVRSLGLLTAHMTLFATKCGLALISILPFAALPWLTKIVMDRVVGDPSMINDAVPYPPFMQPLLDLIEGRDPLSVMMIVLTVFMVMLIFVGLRTAQTELVVPEGRDEATKSENALSAGYSSAGGLLGLVEYLINVRLNQRIGNDLRTRFFERLVRLDIPTLDEQRVGDSIYRVMYDATQVPAICLQLTLSPVIALLSAGLLLYLMNYSYGDVAPEVVWVAIGVIPLGFAITFPFSALARRLNQSSRAAGAATTNAIEENIDNIGAVQRLGGESRELERFTDRSEESFRRSRYVELVNATLIAAGIGVTTLGGVIGFVLITDQIIGETLSAGDFTALIGIFLQLAFVTVEVGLYWIRLQGNVAAVRRVLFMVDYASEADVTGTIDGIRERVDLDGVSYSYPDGRQALADVELSFAVGEMVAIVGPTGAGKTTLAYLLPGYLRPSVGAVRFDGVDIANADPRELREFVTYVFQEHVLLSGTIEENLLLGRPDAPPEAIEKALEIAGATALVESLPDGLQTLISGHGDTLSVGQQQRLSIARGLVRETPILVLDEPTAAFDPVSERELVGALSEVAKERLVIVIAHRLSTIRAANQIVFLEDGRVVETGTHDGLMAADGRYREFVEMQIA